MASIVDIKGGVHRLISRILKTFPDTTVSVAILGEGGILRVFESLGPFSEGRAGREFSLSEGLAGLAVTRREPMRRLRMGVGQKAIRTFGDSDDPRRSVGSVCAVPLEDMGVVLGVLAVESASEQFFTPEDLFLLTAFATVFSLAVSRNNLRESLRMMKENDRITGLPLLSVFYSILTDMVRGVRSRAWSITVLAVDICDFSLVNQTYGYSVGDAVLEMAAARLRKAMGANAVLSRSGADSFLVCLQGVDRVSAEAFSARIHEEFALAPMTVTAGEIPVRVCIGGAVSHVDKMIKKLPEIAQAMAESISGRPGMTSVTEVGQFYELDK
jgi:diguanylate cyclase (GGDEF)-like protein